MRPDAESDYDYKTRMRNLASRLERLDVAAKREPQALPALFEELLKIRIGVLGALDACIRPLTAGIKTTDKFVPPPEVAMGLLLANELFAQMTKVVQALLPKSGPSAYPPVTGAEDVPLATRLWHELTTGDIMVYTRVAEKVDASTMDPDTREVVKREARGITPARLHDLFTRLAVLLYFGETCRDVADVVDAATSGRWLIVITEANNTVATLPGNLSRTADTHWKGTTGWHTGLVIGQEIDSTKLVPSGRIVTGATGPQLRPDIDEGRWCGYTLAAREIYLAHELNHVRRQLSGGWGKGFEKGSEEARVLSSPFSSLEEYRSIYEGELPLRTRLGLQPRGNSTASIDITITGPKPALKELLAYFASLTD